MLIMDNILHDLLEDFRNIVAKTPSFKVNWLDDLLRKVLDRIS